MFLVSAASLVVLFVGTVVPHLVAEPPHPDDAVSVPWLMAATPLAVLTAVGLSTVMAFRLTRPIDGYIDTARRFAAGDHSARPADLGPPEFADLTRALSAAAEEIERSEGARRQLATDIAHELRTPLTALQAGLEELRDGLIPADPATLAALHDQATRLGRIVNDLAELSAAESPGVQLQLSVVDLANVATLALAARRGSMEAAGLVVEEDIDADTQVIADADRMHQVVGNLLANAVLYCRRGDRVASGCTSTAGTACSRCPTPDQDSAPRSCPTCSSAPGGECRPMGPADRGSAFRSSAPSSRPRTAPSRSTQSRGMVQPSRCGCQGRPPQLAAAPSRKQHRMIAIPEASRCRDPLDGHRQPQPVMWSL